MYSRQRRAATAASLIALMTMTACALTPGDKSSAPPSVIATLPATESSDAACPTPIDRRHAGIISDYWYSRLASDLDGVVLPQPDCVRSGRHGDVTLIWMKSDPGFLLTLLSTFDLAGWYETSTSGDLVSFMSPYGTSVSASYVRLGYADSEEPYVALVYVRNDIPPAPGSPGWSR
ncbi:hypothetical protein [Pseudolysinimonas sp.]|uniref:hypothetical protein n=1 Tax=Pseudolysinimonas sp. TaxID=2680009 RepID=UPI00286D4E28|nr:hypothetical protein [Pseudolysinimonas sp.]